MLEPLGKAFVALYPAALNSGEPGMMLAVHYPEGDVAMGVRLSRPKLRHVAETILAWLDGRPIEPTEVH